MDGDSLKVAVFREEDLKPSRTRRRAMNEPHVSCMNLSRSTHAWKEPKRTTSKDGGKIGVLEAGHGVTPHLRAQTLSLGIENYTSRWYAGYQKISN